MNCADFENGLTALAAGEITEDRRGAWLERLRHHAAVCDACGGTTDLLELLALTPGQRDLVSDPGPGYWGTFSGRLAARIADDDAAPAGSRASSAGPRRWVAAAAVIALTSVIGGSLWFSRWPSTEAQELTWLMADNLAQEATGAPVELPGDLAAMIDELSGDQAAAALGGLAGLETDWQRLDWVDTAEGYDALLADLHDWEQVALLGDWLPAGDAESLEYEIGFSGANPGVLTPFPDALVLDADARKELIQWLTAQVS